MRPNKETSWSELKVKWRELIKIEFKDEIVKKKLESEFIELKEEIKNGIV